MTAIPQIAFTPFQGLAGARDEQAVCALSGALSVRLEAPTQAWADLIDTEGFDEIFAAELTNTGVGVLHGRKLVFSLFVAYPKNGGTKPEHHASGSQGVVLVRAQVPGEDQKRRNQGQGQTRKGEKF